jgi:predicted RNase H-like HicB family nuclease
MAQERAMEFTAVFQELPPDEGGGYMALVEELPEIITQGETLEEARANVLDAVKLLLEMNREEATARQLAGSRVIREPITVPLSH